MKKKLNDREFLKEFKRDSTMTEEDAIRLGRELSRRVAKRREQKDT